MLFVYYFAYFVNVRVNKNVLTLFCFILYDSFEIEDKYSVLIMD